MISSAHVSVFSLLRVLAFKLGSAMSVPAMEADEYIEFSGEMPLG